MINNNPYIVPEKPLRQSKISIQPTPLFPHQINRRPEEIDNKFTTQMVKRPNPSYFIENTLNDYSMRSPVNQPQLVKASILQTSAVSQWQDNRDYLNNGLIKQLNDRLSFVSSRLQDHQRKIANLYELKKSQGSTNISQSTIHSYELTNQLMSKQLDKYSNFQSLNQTNSQFFQKVKDQISQLKSQRIEMQEKMKQQIIYMKQTITEQLISNFRQSLNQKFTEEQQRINDFLLQFVTMQQNKLNNKILQLNTELRYQLQKIKEQNIEAKQKQLIYKFDKKYEQHTRQLESLINQYTIFKDHTFKNILLTQNNQREIINLKEKLYLLQNICEKRQIYSYEKYINVSNEKAGNNVVKLTSQSYLNANSRNKDIKFKTNEYTYFIDSDGYLLDNNHYYLLDCNNQKIKIKQADIHKLQQFGVLK